MKGNYRNCLNVVLKLEGGYVNNPRDPGGATNLGITKKTWENFTQRRVSDQEMRNLTYDDALMVYRSNYWDAMKCDLAPCGVDLLMIDCAINSGHYQASKWIRRALEMNQIGGIDANVIDNLSKKDPVDTIKEVLKIRSDFLKGLKTYKTFGKGWENRLETVEKESLAMVKR